MLCKLPRGKSSTVWEPSSVYGCNDGINVMAGKQLFSGFKDQSTGGSSCLSGDVNLVNNLWLGSSEAPAVNLLLLLSENSVVLTSTCFSMLFYPQIAQLLDLIREVALCSVW